MDSEWGTDPLILQETQKPALVALITSDGSLDYRALDDTIITTSSTSRIEATRLIISDGSLDLWP